MTPLKCCSSPAREWAHFAHGLGIPFQFSSGLFLLLFWLLSVVKLSLSYCFIHLLCQLMILLRKKTFAASVSVCVLWWVPQHDAATEETDQSDSFRTMTRYYLVSLVRFRTLVLLDVGVSAPRFFLWISASSSFSYTLWMSYNCCGRCVHGHYTSAGSSCCNCLNTCVRSGSSFWSFGKREVFMSESEAPVSSAEVSVSSGVSYSISS